MESQRILVIDDDLALLESLSALLCPPYLVLSARSAPDALAAVAAGQLDLVILDLCLGDEDGALLLSEIRRRTDAPVLLMTGFSSRENLLRSIRARPDDFLEKPFDGRELLARVAVLLSERRAESDRLERIRARIEREYPRRLTLSMLARQAGMGPRAFRAAFLHRFGVTPHAYLLVCRMRRAAHLLGGARGVKEVAADVGYASASNFSAAFKRRHGLSPRAFRLAARQAPGPERRQGAAGPP